MVIYDHSLRRNHIWATFGLFFNVGMFCGPISPNKTVLVGQKWEYMVTYDHIWATIGLSVDVGSFWVPIFLNKKVLVGKKWTYVDIWESYMIIYQWNPPRKLPESWRMYKYKEWGEGGKSYCHKGLSIRVRLTWAISLHILITAPRCCSLGVYRVTVGIEIMTSV